jgi:hypothetical protein
MFRFDLNAAPSPQKGVNMALIALAVKHVASSGKILKPGTRQHHK